MWNHSVLKMNKAMSIFIYINTLVIMCVFTVPRVVQLDTLYKCAVYDQQNPTNKCNDVANCQTYIKCKFCFATYANVNNTSQLKEQISGCLGNNSKCEKTKSNDGRCVIKHRLKHVHYCCCYGDYCNKNVEIIPANLIPKPTPTRRTFIRLPNHTRKDIFKSNKILYYILPPIFGFIIVLAVLQRLWRKHKRAMSHGAPLLPTSPPQTPPVQSRPIQFHEIISRGQFGFVWKALYDHKVVAVKIIQLHERASWESEKNMYSNYKLRHENILSFHAAEKRCQSDIIQYWIITEYHQYGSLADYLNVQILSFSELTRLVLSMVSGLVYLHGEDLSASPPKPIIAHRDFKSRNVLVTDKLTCCISDFGSACAFPKDYKKDEARAQVGTKRYMAPEVLQGAVAFQAEAFLCIDVYALALVLWEMLSRFSGSNVSSVQPYCAPYEKEVGLHPTIDDMKACVVENNIRPIIKEEWSSDPILVEYCHAIEECWDDDGDARLTAHCVYERLSLISKEESYNQPHIIKLESFNNGERVELFESKPVSSSSSGYLSDHTSREAAHLC